MISRPIFEIEKELDLVREIDEENRQALERSDRPAVEKVFWASSNKHRRDLEEELEAAKRERAFELFGLRVHSARFEQGTMPLRLFSLLTNSINNVVEQAAWNEWNIESIPKVSDEFRSAINLRIAGISRGSTQLQFLGDISPDLSGESALENGLHNLFEVFTSTNEQLAETLNAIGDEATKSMITLLEIFEKERLAVDFSWKAPTKEYHWKGKTEEITRIRSMLQEIGDPLTTAISIVGVVGSISRRSVRIDTEGEERITAKYHHSLYDQVATLHLDDRKEFFVELTSYPEDSFDIKRDAYRLVAIRDTQPTKTDDN